VSLPSSHPRTAYLRSAASRHTPCAALQQMRLRLRGGGGTDGTGGGGGGGAQGAPQRTSSLDNMLSGISAKSQEFASGVSRFPSFLLNTTANSKPTAPAPGADAPAAVNQKPPPPPPPPKDGEMTSLDSQMRKKKRKSWPVRQRLWASFTDVFHALAALEQAPGTLMKSKADDKAEFIRSLWRGMMPVMSYACCSIYMVSMCL
jgi:hypothetical protein